MFSSFLLKSMHNANQILNRNLETHVVRLDLDLVRSGQQRAELLSTPRPRTLKGPKRTPKQNWKKPVSTDYLSSPTGKNVYVSRFGKISAPLS